MFIMTFCDYYFDMTVREGMGGWMTYDKGHRCGKRKENKYALTALLQKVRDNRDIGDHKSFWPVLRSRVLYYYCQGTYISNTHYFDALTLWRDGKHITRLIRLIVRFTRFSLSISRSPRQKCQSFLRFLATRRDQYCTEIVTTVGCTVQLYSSTRYSYLYCGSEDEIFKKFYLYNNYYLTTEIVVQVHAL